MFSVNQFGILKESCVMDIAVNKTEWTKKSYWRINFNGEELDSYERSFALQRWTDADHHTALLTDLHSRSNWV